MLHLLTGEEPYEELLKHVRCPKYLSDALAAIWTDPTMDIDNPYFVIKELVESLELPPDEATDEVTGGGQDDRGAAAVLFDTVYRYFVLFGVHADMLPQWKDKPPGQLRGSEDATSSGVCTNRNSYDGGVSTLHPWVQNPVWNALLDAIGCASFFDFATYSSLVLGSKTGVGRGGAGRRRRGGQGNADKEQEAFSALRADSIAQFQRHHSEWSVHIGSHRTMLGLRHKLKALGGKSAWRLFERMVHFDPAKRCTMHEALLSPVFACLRATKAASAPDQSRRKPEKVNQALS